MRIFFRVDASTLIGTGHVMRCLSLAAGLRKKNAEVLFVSRLHSGNLNAFIREQGFECLDLPAPGNHPQRIVNSKKEYENWLALPQQVDAEECSKLIEQNADAVIVDHYGLDATWEKNFRSPKTKLIAIDDLANRKHECDLLIDQNLQPGIHQKYPQLTSPETFLCLGPAYALLRPEFSEARKNLKERSAKLEAALIFFGGNDASNESLKALKACVQIPSLHQIDLVVGAINPHQEVLTQFSKEYPQVKIHQQVKLMSKLMLQADLAFGAGGVTTWERACLGLPTIAWSLAENQQNLLKAMDTAGALIDLGLSEQVSEEKILNALEGLQNDPQQILEMSEKAKSLVDGLGVERSVLAICSLALQLRKAKESDEKNLFEWRNHEESRKFSHNSKTITWEEHQLWFEKSLANPQRLLWIAEKEGKAIGVLRYDLEDTEALTSIYLVPGNSGQHYGTQILIAGAQNLKRNYPQIKLLKAEIREDNQASQKAFEKAGYQLQNKVWVRTL